MMNAIGKIAYAGATAPTGNVNKTAPPPEGSASKIKAGEAKPIVDLSSTRSTPFSDVASPAPLVAETFERHDSGVKERKRQNWLGGKYSIYATDAAVLGDAIFNKILYGSKESRLDKDAIDVADIEKVINDPKFRVVLDEEVVPTNRLLIELNNIKKAAQKYGATTGEWFKGPMLKRDDLRKFYCEEDGSFPGSCVPSVTTKKTQEYRGRKS